MEKKIKTLMKINIIFYLFIFIHKKYYDDSVPQMIFYMLLAFSSGTLELAIRNKIKKLYFIAGFDIGLRIITIVIHFIFITMKANSIFSNACIVTILITNVIVEIIMLKKGESITIEKVDEVKQREVNIFIEEFCFGKLNLSEFEVGFDKEVGKVIEVSKISGRRTVVIAAILVLLLASQIIFNYLYSRSSD